MENSSPSNHADHGSEPLPETPLTKPLSDCEATLPEVARQIARQMAELVAADRRHREQLKGLRRLATDMVAELSVSQPNFESYQGARARYQNAREMLDKDEAQYHVGLGTTAQNAYQALDSFFTQLFSSILPLMGADRVQKHLNNAVSAQNPQPSAAPSLRDHSESLSRELLGRRREHAEAESSDNRARPAVESGSRRYSKRQRTGATNMTANINPNTNATRDTDTTETTTTTGIAIRGDPEIEFNEVYENGKAIKKYYIIEREFTNPETQIKASFWILRCQADEFNYAHEGGTRAIFKIASKHVSKRHLHPGSDVSILTMLGVAVRNCDKELAARNNKSVVAACKDGYKAKMKMTDPVPEEAAAAPAGAQTSGRRPRARQRPEPSPSDAEESESESHSDDDREEPPRGVIPTPGRFYLTFWPNGKGKGGEWYLSLCLPMSHDVRGFTLLGLHSTFESSNLTEMMSKEYEYVAVGVNRMGVRLKAGFSQYKEGGKMAHERDYPFINFDNEVGVEKCTYAWVPKKSIAIYTPDRLSNKRVLPMAREYIKMNQHRLKDIPTSLLPSATTATDGDEMVSESSGRLEEVLGATAETQRQPPEPCFTTVNGTATGMGTDEPDIYEFLDDENDSPESDANFGTETVAEVDPSGVPPWKWGIVPMNAGIILENHQEQPRTISPTPLPVTVVPDQAPALAAHVSTAENSPATGYDGDFGAPEITRWDIHPDPSIVEHVFQPNGTPYGGSVSLQATAASAPMEPTYRGPVGVASATSTSDPPCPSGDEDQTQGYGRPWPAVIPTPPISQSVNDPGSMTSSRGGPNHANRPGRPPIMSVRDEMFKGWREHTNANGLPA